jgi:hypothetical protein
MFVSDAMHRLQNLLYPLTNAVAFFFCSFVDTPSCQACLLRWLLDCQVGLVVE